MLILACGRTAPLAGADQLKDGEATSSCEAVGEAGFEPSSSSTAAEPGGTSGTDGPVEVAAHYYGGSENIALEFTTFLNATCTSEYPNLECDEPRQWNAFIVIPSPAELGAYAIASLDGVVDTASTGPTCGVRSDPLEGTGTLLIESIDGTVIRGRVVDATFLPLHEMVWNFAFEAPEC